MLEITAQPADQLQPEQWHQLQVIARRAAVHTLPNRTPEEINYFVDWDNPARYYQSHLDPAILIGDRYTDNQAFWSPTVVTAKAGGKYVGFASGDVNVSGPNQFWREVKHATLLKSYFRLREIAVLPDWQLSGIGYQIGRRLLSQANPLQPVATYVLGNEPGMAWLPQYLSRLGFAETGRVDSPVFGDQRPAATVMRLQARTALGVRWHLKPPQGQPS